MEEIVAVDEHLIVSPQISIEVKRLVSSMEIQAGNSCGFFLKSL